MSLLSPDGPSGEVTSRSPSTIGAISASAPSGISEADRPDLRAVVDGRSRSTDRRRRTAHPIEPDRRIGAGADRRGLLRHDSEASLLRPSPEPSRARLERSPRRGEPEHRDRGTRRTRVPPPSSRRSSNCVSSSPRLLRPRIAGFRQHLRRLGRIGGDGTPSGRRSSCPAPEPSPTRPIRRRRSCRRPCRRTTRSQPARACT